MHRVSSGIEGERVVLHDTVRIIHPQGRLQLGCVEGWVAHEQVVLQPGCFAVQDAEAGLRFGVRDYACSTIPTSL